MSIRPVVYLGGEHLARAAAASSGQPHPPPPHMGQYPGGIPGMQLAKYPEVALFSQLGQLFPKSSTSAAPAAPAASAPREAASPSSKAGSGRTGNSDSKSSYASRHQAAEQRRRTRINDRLDQLRTIVPHAERANTAAFLEEVINYISSLKDHVKELEEKVGETSNTKVKPEGKKRKAEANGQESAKKKSAA